MRYQTARLLLTGCFWLMTINGFAQEQKIADSLAPIYQQDTLTDTAKLAVLSDLSFNEIRDLQKGLTYAEELIRLAAQSKNTKYLRMGYFLVGTKKRVLGDLDDALAAY